MGLNMFNHAWTGWVSYVFPAALVSLVLSKFLAEHVTGQFRLLIQVALCWMEVPWLLTVLSMLEDIPHQSSFIRNLIMDVLIGQMPKDQSMFLTHWLLRDMYYPDKGFLFYLGDVCLGTQLVLTALLFQAFWNHIIITRLQITLSFLN